MKECMKQISWNVSDGNTIKKCIPFPSAQSYLTEICKG